MLVAPVSLDDRFAMYLFRLLTILILLPVTVLSGMPRVGCRCSNGEVHLSCPKLRAEQSKRASDATACCDSQKPAAQKSCCGGKQSTGCCGSNSRKSPNEDESCCEAGCRCTPVLLKTEVALKLAKACVPDLAQHDLANTSVTASLLVRVARIEICRIEAKPDVPIDLVVLYERFLI